MNIAIPRDASGHIIQVGDWVQHPHNDNDVYPFSGKIIGRVDYKIKESFTKDKGTIKIIWIGFGGIDSRVAIASQTKLLLKADGTEPEEALKQLSFDNRITDFGEILGED